MITTGVARGSAFRYSGLIAVCVFAVACTRGGDVPQTKEGGPGAAAAPANQSTAPAGHGLTIDFASTPDPPAAGENTFDVTVRNADGSPVTDAAVTTVFSMPAMPSMNMPPMSSDVTLTHVEAGRYRGTGELSMGGTWNVVVTVSRAGQPIGTKRFSIVAK